MHSSNGLTITCRPKRGWLSAQDFEALKKDGYGYNSTEFCKAGGCSRCFAGAGRRSEGGSLAGRVRGRQVRGDRACVLPARERPYRVYARLHVRAFLPSSLEQSDGGDRLPGAAVTRAQDDRVDQARGRAQGTHLQVCCSVGMDEHPNR